MVMTRRFAILVRPANTPCQHQVQHRSQLRTQIVLRTRGKVIMVGSALRPRVKLSYARSSRRRASSRSFTF
jgi:hypothetical protein